MRYIVGQYRFPYAFQAMKSLSSPTGYSSPCSRTARSTFSTDRSTANSGEWTPTTVKSGWYRPCIRRRNGRVRWQFTHAKVQNSSRTTRPRRVASLSGSPSGVLNHGLTPTSWTPSASSPFSCARAMLSGILVLTQPRSMGAAGGRHATGGAGPFGQPDVMPPPADRVQPLVVSGLEVTQLRRARRTDRGRGVAVGANSDRRIRVEYSATETGHPHRQRPARDTSPSVQLERKYIPAQSTRHLSPRSIALRY